MARNRGQIKIDLDASGVEQGARQANQAIGGIGSTADKQGQSLNRYGERLGRVFGPGEGLHGRLDALEMPLRDVEGSFDRAVVASATFGNAGATAADKISDGFLLASDGIAAFTSGGLVGLATAAVITLGVTIADQMSKAEEKTKEAAKRMKDLATAAFEAGLSIELMLKKQEAERFAKEAVQSEEAVRQARLQITRIRGQIQLAEEAEKRLRRAGEHRESTARLGVMAQLEFLKNSMKQQRKIIRTHQKNVIASEDNAARASGELAEKKVLFEISTFGKKLAAFKSTLEEVRESEESSHRASMARIKKRDAAVQALTASLIENDIKALESAKERERNERELIDSFFEYRKEKAVRVESLLAKIDAAALKQQMERFSLAQRGFQTITNSIFEMAKAGEFSLNKLLEATLGSIGQELVARGTMDTFKGLAMLTIGQPGGAALAGIGAAEISSGVALGAASGAIGRAGAPEPVPSSSPAPADTRSTRAAESGAADSGGPVIITFQGDVYDRRGVAQVLNQGLGMAKHRRLRGA